MIKSQDTVDLLSPLAQEHQPVIRARHKPAPSQISQHNYMHLTISTGAGHLGANASYPSCTPHDTEITGCIRIDASLAQLYGYRVDLGVHLARVSALNSR